MRRLIVSITLVAALAGCKKKSDPPPKTPGAAKSNKAPKEKAKSERRVAAKTEASAPASASDLIGQGSVGSIDALTQALEPYLSAMGARQLTWAVIKAKVAKWIGLMSWTGVDNSRPVRVWLVDPKKYKFPVIVGLPRAKAGKIKTDWPSAAVGDYTLVTKRQSVLNSFKPLLEKDLSKPSAKGADVAFTVSVTKFMKAFERDLRSALRKIGQAVSGRRGVAGGLAKIVRWLLRAAVDLGHQIESASARLTPGKDKARLSVTLNPKSGSALSKVLGLLKPAKSSLLSHVAADISAGLVATIPPPAMKAIATGIVDHIEKLGEDGPKKLGAFLRKVAMPLLEDLSGDFAFVKRTTGGGPSVMLFASSKAKSTLGHLSRAYQDIQGMLGGAMSRMRIKTTSKYKKNAGTYKGSKFDRMRVTMDFSKLPKFQAKLLARLVGSARDTYLAARGDYVTVVDTSGTKAEPLHDALDRVDAKSGKGLDSKAEYKSLAADLPANRFLTLYFSFVDYLKQAISALGRDRVPPQLAAIQGEGYLGAGVSVQNAALQIDALATRSQIEGIRKLFGALKGMQGRAMGAMRRKAGGAGADPAARKKMLERLKKQLEMLKKRQNIK